MPLPAHYLETIVTPAASRHIEAYWSYTAVDSGSSLILPDGRCDIIVRFNIDATAPAVPIITGPGTESYNVLYQTGDCWLGVRLRPGNGHLLWREDIHNAANKVLRGKEATALVPELGKLNHLDRQQLSPAVLAQTLQSAKPFSHSDDPDVRIEQAIDLLHVTGGRLAIDELAASVNCSTRHLNRLFQATVGLSTKLYSQLVQFHRTLSLIQHSQMPITDAALEGGYSDQAHLNRTFKRFGGFAPTRTPAELSVPTLFSA